VSPFKKGWESLFYTKNKILFSLEYLTEIAPKMTHLSYKPIATAIASLSRRMNSE
jgi:hypothetical protein